MRMQVMPRGTKKITVAVRGPITSKRWCIAPGSGSSTRAAGFQSVTPSTSDPKAPWHADESSDEVPAGALPTDSEPVTSDALTPSSSSEDLIPGLTTPSTLTSPDASQLEDSFDLMDIVGDTFDTRDVINLIKTASQPAPPSPHDSVPQRPPRIGLLGSTGLYTTHGLGADVPTAVAEPPRGPTCKPSTRRTTFNAAKTCGVKATPRSLSEFNSNDKTVRAAAPSPLQQTKRTLGSIGNSGLYSTKGPEAEIARRDVDWVVGLMNLAAHLVQGRAEQEAKKQVSLPECPIQSCCACPFFEMVTKGMLSKAMSGLSLWGVLHKLQVSPHARWMLVECDSTVGFLRMLKKLALLYPVVFERTLVVLEIICECVHKKSLYALVSWREDKDEWLCYGGLLDSTFRGFPGEPGW